jgi:hypothetical protein
MGFFMELTTPLRNSPHSFSCLEGRRYISQVSFSEMLVPFLISFHLIPVKGRVGGTLASEPDFGKKQVRNRSTEQAL